MFNNNSAVLPFCTVGVALQCWRSFGRQQALVNGVWLAWSLQRGDIDESFVLSRLPSFTEGVFFDILGPAGLLGSNYFVTFEGS